ncbi:hypothetical protein CS0771_18560 [Catellatospora sp. IY07-71]|uniref:hypothetical protein n=1 Tax=Catellatospora sp. IY07-71 TaxID=2728827 RepID=UPI001BB4404D|nr:hypothetical protein [Catellatospora sp. IY07-71]BCJ72312.1 hypothetical protein CS0771_18560 [Catellatospora sp. IY07-71]
MSSPSRDTGPIEFVSKADRRAAKAAAKAAAQAAKSGGSTASGVAGAGGTPGSGPAAPGGRPGSGPASRAGKPASRWAPLFGGLSVIGVIGAFVAWFLIAPTLRRLLIGFACDVTACSAAGMTTAGWLVVAAPASAMLLIGVSWQRAGRTARRVMIGFAVLTWLVAMLVIPGRGKDLSDILTGPGSAQLGEGILWALGGAGAALAFLFLLVFVGRAVPAVDRRYNTVAVAGIAAMIVGALPLAIDAAEPTYARAAEVFPAVLKMNGDTLTRTELGDERGCDGVLPDDTLLDRHGCIVTVRASYMTDDSDAIAVFRAVLYRDDETADEARAGLPAGLAPVGAPGGAVAIFSTTGPWVLVSAGAHDNGREVTAADRPWVLWPLRQVSYHFIGTQVGLLIDPDPTDAIRPRNP